MAHHRSGRGRDISRVIPPHGSRSANFQTRSSASCLDVIPARTSPVASGTLQGNDLHPLGPQRLRFAHTSCARRPPTGRTRNADRYSRAAEKPLNPAGSLSPSSRSCSAVRLSEDVYMGPCGVGFFPPACCVVQSRHRRGLPGFRVWSFQTCMGVCDYHKTDRELA
jgi:hypothetical protein